MAGIDRQPRQFASDGHVGVIEEPDLIHLSYIGDVKLDNIRDVLEEMAAHCNLDGGVRLLINIEKMGSLEPAARKHIANETRLRSVALYGGGFAQRVVANLMIRAVEMVNRDSVPTRLFSGETEARTWLRAPGAEQGGAS